MKLAGVVLCGGASARMGRSKAGLVWGGETLLSRAVRKLTPVVNGLFVSHARGQELPAVAGEARFVSDDREACGPLAGLSRSLGEVSDCGFDAALVLAVDMPLVPTDILCRIAAALRPEDEAVVPVNEGESQPLCAVYRVTARSRMEAAIQAGRYSVRQFLKALPHQLLAIPSDVGTAANAFSNINTPEDYEALLKSCEAP